MNSRRSLDHLVGTCRSQNGALWNVALRPPGQSAFMPANFTTLPHFSVSSAMSLPKSAREPASNAPPLWPGGFWIGERPGRALQPRHGGDGPRRFVYGALRTKSRAAHLGEL